MSGGKIDLKLSLEDSPQTQAAVSALYGKVVAMRDSTELLSEVFEALRVHQQKVCEGTDALAQLLNSFQNDGICDDGFLGSSFSRIRLYLMELHSCQDMLGTQLQNAVIELLNSFIATDFTEIDKLKENYETASQEHEQATIKYSRVSKKKDSEKTRFEANSDLFSVRKKYYESCLDYYSKLNGFQLKWKYSLMEPLLTYMHAQMAFFKAGHEVLNKDLGKTLNELNLEVQKFHSQHQVELSATAEEREDIEMSLPSLCLPDPDPSDPFTDFSPPKNNLTSKAGHLFIRGEKRGFISQWDRSYFFIKDSTLYSEHPQKEQEKVVHLKTASASAADIDDRRFVFQVTSSNSKKQVYLMAESDWQRDEWVTAINNNSKEMGRAGDRTSGSGKEAERIRQERIKIKEWLLQQKKLPEPTPPKSDSSRHTRSSSSHGISLPARPASKSPVLPVRPKPTRPAPPQNLSTGHLPSPIIPEKVPSSSRPPTPQSPTAARKFSVKYLGHTEIKDGPAKNVITDTIRKVMAARSVQNVKSAVDIEMTVGSKSIVFMDLKARKPIGQIQLKSVIQCSTHPDNYKLMGVVNRSTAEPDKPRYICHVLESEYEGSKICKVIESSVKAVPVPPPRPSTAPSQPPRPYVVKDGYVTFEKNTSTELLLPPSTGKPPIAPPRESSPYDPGGEDLTDMEEVPLVESPPPSPTSTVGNGYVSNSTLPTHTPDLTHDLFSNNAASASDRFETESVWSTSQQSSSGYYKDNSFSAQQSSSGYYKADSASSQQGSAGYYKDNSTSAQQNFNTEPNDSLFDDTFTDMSSSDSNLLSFSSSASTLTPLPGPTTYNTLHYEQSGETDLGEQVDLLGELDDTYTSTDNQQSHNSGYYTTSGQPVGTSNSFNNSSTSATDNQQSHNSGYYTTSGQPVGTGNSFNNSSTSATDNQQSHSSGYYTTSGQPVGAGNSFNNSSNFNTPSPMMGSSNSAFNTPTPNTSDNSSNFYSGGSGDPLPPPMKPLEGYGGFDDDFLPPLPEDDMPL